MKKITTLGILFLISLTSFIAKAEINFDLTTVSGGSISLNYDAVSTERNKLQAERWITVVNFGASGTSGLCSSQPKAFDIKLGRTIAFYLAKCDKMIISANIATGRGLTYTINDGASTTLAGTSACKDYEVLVNSETPVKIIVQGLNSSSAWTSLFTFNYVAKTPTISSFKINGTSAAIDQSLKTISLQMPYGTDISNVTPEVTITSATGYTPAGAQNFTTGAITYAVTDGTTTNNYTANITAKATPDTEKAITSLSINGRAATINEATGAITCEFPSFTGALGNWPVVYTINTTTGSANYTSNTNYDFATNGTLSITVTAQDLSTKVYTITPAISTKRNIGMLTLNGKAEAYDNILLTAFSDYLVNFLAASTTAPTDVPAFYANYDLIVLHSNVSGTNATGVASKAMVGVKPVLNLKAFFYNSGRWSWSTVAPANPATPLASSEVALNLQNHPVFANVTFTGTTLPFYDNLVSTNLNAIQYASDLATLTSGMTSQTIATVNTTGIQMHEIQDNVAAKYMMIALGSEYNNYNNLNSNAVNVLKNASAYLLNTSSKYNYGTTALTSTANKQNLYFSNGVIQNPDQHSIVIYNTAGLRVQFTNEKMINTSALAKGVYLIQADNNQVIKFIK
jgi:hypothetical protein